MNPKIIATVGLKTESYEMLKAMALAGTNIVRLNFSHATPEQWFSVQKSLKKIKKEIGLEVKMMMDLQGPRVRIGQLPHEIHLNEGDVYCFCSRPTDLDKKEIFIDHKDLIDDVEVGHPFYLANGAIEMDVTAIKNGCLFAKVERGGLLASRKGINVPKTTLRGGALTKKDIEDAKFGATHGADFMCLSFVQSSEDVKKLRKIVANDKIQIIAKIERAPALEVIDDIIQASDGIMVARGDLGIEVPMEELPILQKHLIRLAHWHEKPAIVATEMMASMAEKPKPTRAEVSDVANAVFDGADAIMLSDETAVGKYPIETIKAMKKIAKRADDYFNNTNYLKK